MSPATSNGNGKNGHTVTTKVAAPRSSEGVRDTVVTFRTADGLLRHGTVVRATLHSVHFEVYDSTLVWRLSEVLEGLQISFQGKVFYNGSAVIRSLTESGFKSSCEAKLREECWKGLDPLSALKHADTATAKFTEFLSEWQKLCKVHPNFKTASIDLLTFFSDSQIWLNQMELEIRLLPAKAQPRAERDLLEELEPQFIRATTGITERFEHALNQVDRDLLPLHQAFLRRFLHPVTQSSPFMHRAFEKPLGYAGDYGVVDLMFQDRFQGVSFFAKLLNAYALQLPPVSAHRNRIHYLINLLTQESLRVRRQGRKAKIFNLGCGPAREVQQFLTQSELSNWSSFVLADFEEETLKHTQRVLQDLKQRHERKCDVQTVKLSVAQLLKDRARQERRGGVGEYDVVYCAGLFDYLTQSVCQQLMDAFYDMLAPGGMLVATNVDIHPAINQMECFLDWHLMYRNTQTMRELTPKNADRDEVTIRSDDSGVNIFIEVRK